jgi:hypothetical protein
VSVLPSVDIDELSWVEAGRRLPFAFAVIVKAHFWPILLPIGTPVSRIPRSLPDICQTRIVKGVWVKKKKTKNSVKIGRMSNGFN